MKNTLIKYYFFIYLLLMVLPFYGENHSSSVEVSKWKYKSDLNIEDNRANGVIEVSLPSTLLDKAQKNLGDLRLINKNHRFIPYIIKTKVGHEKHSPPYSPKNYLNETFKPNHHSSIVADFGNNQLRNFLIINTTGENYRRRIMIEGGNDGLTWKVLTNNGWIFAIPKSPPIPHINKVNIPENNFRYYRINVYNSDNDPEKVTISSIQASHLIKVQADLVTVPVTDTKVSLNTKKQFTEIELDLAYANLPIDNIILDFHDKNFMRHYTLLGRNSKMHTLFQKIENSPPKKILKETPWTKVRHGHIYRFTTNKGVNESLTLKSHGKFRYISIRIHNKDNHPISFISATVRRLNQRLLFQHQGKQTLHLLFGNDKAKAPSYDLANYVNGLAKERILTLNIKDIETNPLYHTPKQITPWSEKHKWLLTAAIIFLIIVLASLIWNQLKETSSKT